MWFYISALVEEEKDQPTDRPLRRKTPLRKGQFSALGFATFANRTKGMRSKRKELKKVS